MLALFCMLDSSESNSSFILDSDQADYLRMESQSLSPKEQTEFQNLVKSLHGLFMDKFGSLLRSPASNQKMAEKFIILDNDTYDVVNEDWERTEGARIEKYTSDKGHGRAFKDSGNFVVSLPIDLWKDFSEDKKKRYMEQLKLSNAEAEKYVNTVMKSNIVLHEMTHLYQKPGTDLPLWLTEAQAYWIARELPSEEMKIHTSEFDKRADLYKALLEKFGDELHKICFGTSTDQSILNFLRTAITPRIKELGFLEYEGK
jgi:hypothetical protein